MAFRLRIERIDARGGETLIRGRLMEGSYFGPQCIRVRDSAGNARTAAIVTQTLVEPKGWPVTADHDTQLELHIATPPFIIDRSGVVEGLGSVAPREGSTDLTKELFNPFFGGVFSDLHMTSETMENPCSDFLGLTEEEVNGYYEEFLAPLIESPAWPIFPLDVDGKRYVEIEWAGGPEPQNRVWIGTKEPGRRALLGYDSGHFSLPGLRPRELLWLLDRLQRSGAHPAAGLMLMPMCYLPAPDPLCTERLARLCAFIPGANPTLANRIATTMVERLIVPDASWERKPRYGWCSNWDYSQRNPQSRLSVLSEGDFQFIDQFFAEIGR